jgi:hypothetical protein
MDSKTLELSSLSWSSSFKKQSMQRKSLFVDLFFFFITKLPKKETLLLHLLYQDVNIWELCDLASTSSRGFYFNFLQGETSGFFKNLSW